MGDGEMRRARVARRDLARRAREARQPDLRHQLQPAAPRRPGARQRQDHPGARRRVPRRRLERDQGAVGQRLGHAAREGQERPAAASAWRSASTASTRTSSASDGAYVREHFFGKYPELKALVADMSDDEIWRLNRGGHDPHKVYAAYAAAVKHKGQPTRDPRQDGQGLRHGRVGRRPDDRAPAEEDDAGRAEAVPRPLPDPGPRRQARRACRSSSCPRTARR